MNGLFNSKFGLYDSFFKKTNYNEIFDNLGSTLTNLYIVDLIIQENTAFKDYWEQYNDMFSTVKSNMDKYNMTSKMLKKLQRFCSKIYANILSGKLYEEFLSGLKESIRMDLEQALFKNKTFLEKYTEYIKKKIDDVQVQLQGPGVMTAHADYMNLLINYSVYRKLFGNEDEKLYKKIWALQQKAPILILYNNLFVQPGTFLTTVCTLTKKCKTEPSDIKVFLQQECYFREKLFAATVKQYYMRLVNWITLMNSDMLKDNEKMAQDKSFMKIRAQQISSGI